MSITVKSASSKHDTDNPLKPVHKTECLSLLTTINILHSKDELLHCRLSWPRPVRSVSATSELRVAVWTKQYPSLLSQERLEPYVLFVVLIFKKIFILITSRSDSSI